MTTALLIILTIAIAAITLAAIVFVKKYFMPMQQKIADMQQVQKACSVATFHARIPRILEKIEDLPAAQGLVNDLTHISNKMNNNYNLHHDSITAFTRRIDEFEKFFAGVKDIIQDFQEKDEQKHLNIDSRLNLHERKLAEHTRQIRNIKKQLNAKKDKL